MSSGLGVSDEKILALEEYERSPHYSPAERVAPRYADAITLSDRDVDDALFAELKEHYKSDPIVEQTASIAWENATSNFKRSRRIPSQEL